MISRSRVFQALFASFFLLTGCATNVPTPVLEQQEPVITWDPNTGHGEWEDCGTQLGDHACNFEFLDQHGNMWELYDHYGDVIILDFSTMWCSVCQYAATKVQSIQDLHEGQGLTWVTVLIQNLQGTSVSVEAAMEWAMMFGIKTAPVLAANDDIAKPGVEGSFLIKTLPTIVIIDRDMVIRYRLDSWNEARAISQIEELIAE